MLGFPRETEPVGDIDAHLYIKYIFTYMINMYIFIYNKTYSYILIYVIKIVNILIHNI